MKWGMPYIPSSLPKIRIHITITPASLHRKLLPRPMMTSVTPADSLRIANVDPLDDKTYEEAGALIKELIGEYIASANAIK